MEDGVIVELYWQRDQRAIGASEEKYGGLCRSLSWNILQSREDAEECVNDTWHRAWNTMPPQRPASLAAYLGRIVRNLALDLYRKRRAARRGGGGAELLLSELAECVPAREGGVLCSEEELSGVIDGWLRGLPPGDRRLFLRRYWYGEGVGELARSLGERPERLSLRLFRLRGKLREQLEKEGIAL